MMGFSDLILFPMNMSSMFFGAIIGVLLFVFLVWMIIDCAGRKFKNSAEKIIWIIVMIFTTWIGALVYFIVIKNMNSRGLLK